MNKWIGIGNIASEIELRYTTGDSPLAICNFSIAINEGYGEKKKAYFFKVTAFGKTAENTDKFCSKGSKVAIEGSLYTDTYEKDGQKKYITGIKAQSVEFMPKGESSGEGQKTADKSSQASTEAQMGFSALSEDDIPF